MIADPSPLARDIAVPGADPEDRRHLRAFRGVVHELARLVARLEDARHDVDLPGILRAAQSTVGLDIDALEVTARSLRAMREALDLAARPVRLVP